MSTENPCIGCRQSCCDTFFVDKKTPEIPPFIRVLWDEENIMYCSCDNFDRENKVCLDYANRPIFCRETANKGKFPHNDCLLKQPEDYAFWDDFGL